MGLTLMGAAAFGFRYDLAELPISFFQPGISPVTETTDSLALQISSDIAKTLTAHAQAETLLEWHESFYTPDSIFAQVAALRNPQAWSALCATLSKLPVAKLTLFEDSIANRKEHMHCAPTLLSSISEYWHQEQAKLPSLASSASGTPKTLKTVTLKLPSLNASLPSDGGLKEGQVAITFDGGPHPTRTARILDILKRAKVRATFFQIGENSTLHSAISSRIAREGHSIASMGQSDRALSRLDENRAQKEISIGRQSVALAAAQSSNLFRFPYETANTSLLELAQNQNMVPVPWSIDPRDWKSTSPTDLLETTVAELENNKRGILLLNDSIENTVIFLPHLLNMIRKKSYTPIVFLEP